MHTTERHHPPIPGQKLRNAFPAGTRSQPDRPGLAASARPCRLAVGVGVMLGVMLPGGFLPIAGGSEQAAPGSEAVAAESPASAAATPNAAASEATASEDSDRLAGPTHTARPAREVATEIAAPKPARPEIDLVELRNHVQTLASDALEGREAGTRGGQAAGSYLATRFRRLQLVPAGDEQSWFQYFQENCRNVLAKIPGKDPTDPPAAASPRPLIILGAHYDHVGYGRRNNSRGPLGQIHNGADDNASGVAVLLEAARLLQQQPEPLNCTVLFACWDAEEQGLLGSRHWLEHSGIPPAQIRLSINLDMVGRLRDGRVEVSGVRIATGLRQLLTESNRETDLQLDCLWDLIADSDHYPFVERQVPTVMLHTGKHPEYHRPADDVPLLNLKGMQQITRLVLSMIRRADQQSSGLDWRQECLTETDELRAQIETPLARRPSRLGVTTWREEAGGIAAGSLRAGGAAERAGLQPGDLIQEFAGEPVVSVAELQRRVFSAPAEVSLLVLREGEAGPRPFAVALDGRPLRFGIHWRTDDAEPGHVILDRVTAGSPAEDAGLAAGDRIFRINGLEFHSHREFHELITRTDWPEQTGDRLVLETERQGRTRTLTVIPAEQTPAAR